MLLKNGDANFLLLFSPTSLSRLSLSSTVILIPRPRLFSPPVCLPVLPSCFLCRAAEGRFLVLANNNLQIKQVTKADEGVYRCEASVEARGEIDFVDIAVVVNGGYTAGVWVWFFFFRSDFYQTVSLEFECLCFKNRAENLTGPFQTISITTLVTGCLG